MFFLMRCRWGMIMAAACTGKWDSMCALEYFFKKASSPLRDIEQMGQLKTRALRYPVKTWGKSRLNGVLFAIPLDDANGTDAFNDI